jgi:hypothetical protein
LETLNQHMTMYERVFKKYNKGVIVKDWKISQNAQSLLASFPEKLYLDFFRQFYFQSL